MLGQKVAEANYGSMNAGQYQKSINMERLSSGLYLYRIEATGADGAKFIAERKLLLLK